MILYPNCKINIGLNVISRREDGYHNIETVFLPIPLADCLEVVPAEADEFCIDGRQLDCAKEDNLVVRVLTLLREEGYAVPPVAVRLTKNIPSGAGLGGGSTDAAFMMKGLNDLFSLGMEVAEMERLVGRLGADCPVFVRNQPVYAQGIGNEFSELPVALMQKRFELPTGIAGESAEMTLSIPAPLHDYWLLLVKPDDFVSTREAYGNVAVGPSAEKLPELLRTPVKEWRGRVRNSFEDSVFPAHPNLADIRERLYLLGARYVAMSGSGSTMYGLFRHRPEVGDVFQGDFTWMVQL